MEKLRKSNINNDAGILACLFGKKMPFNSKENSESKPFEITKGISSHYGKNVSILKLYEKEMEADSHSELVIKTKKFFFFNNPDGSIRWIIPQDAKSPNFLKFYSASSLKAKAISFVFKLAYLLRLQKFVMSGILELNYSGTNFLDELTEKIGSNNYSIFTGTKGPNRKVLICFEGNDSKFVKIPFGENSVDLIKREVQVVNEIEVEKLRSIKFPAAHYLNESKSGVFENIDSGNLKRGNDVTELHIKASLELFASNKKSVGFNESEFANRINQNLNNIKEGKIFGELKTELVQLHESLSDKRSILSGRSHGDYTPWNIFIGKNKLFVYDWELSQAFAPILFDLFHFVFQSEILVKQSTWSEIKDRLLELENSPQIIELVKEHNIDFETYFELYLLENVSYYLKVYQNQETLHAQCYWLYEIWAMALKETNMKKNKYSGLEESQTHRQRFITEQFNFLSSKDYALLKFSERSLDLISDSSDLDILIEEKQENEIIAWMVDHRLLEKYNRRSFSFANYFEFFFKDGSYLQVDLINTLKRKSLVMLNTSEVLSATKLTGEGVKVPDLKHDLQYCLAFYYLNNSGIPEKYIEFFKGLPSEMRQDLMVNLKQSFDIKIKDFTELSYFKADIQNKIETHLNDQKNNQSLNKISNKMTYLIDSIKRVFNNNGLVISFSGVDGAGKSTLINEVKQQAIEKYRKPVKVIRHRPSILPILSSYKYGKEKAEQRAASTLPRQGGNASKIGSLLRFTYYYMDYLFGQIYIYFKYIKRGYIVLYDRYYFDFINDSKRTNIVINKSLVKFLYRFIAKPDLNFFIYASPEVILKRKQELSSEDIVSLTKSYSNLFNEFTVKFKNSKYVQLNNIDLSQTTNSIMNELSKVV